MAIEKMLSNKCDPEKGNKGKTQFQEVCKVVVRKIIVGMTSSVEVIQSSIPS